GPGARVDDLDAGAVADLLVTGRDHHGVGIEATDHLCLSGLSQAEPDLRQHGAAIDYPVDDAFRVAGEDGGFGHEHRVVAPLHHDLYARKKAGKQQTIRVRDPGAQPHGASVHVDDRVDGIDRTLEGTVGHGVHGYADV